MRVVSVTSGTISKTPTFELQGSQEKKRKRKGMGKGDLKHNTFKQNNEKEQTRNTEVQINEEEIGKLPEKEFRITIVKVIKNLENKMQKTQESINKDIEVLKNKHTETSNTITEIKNTLEGINSRISEVEE